MGRRGRGNTDRKGLLDRPKHAFFDKMGSLEWKIAVIARREHAGKGNFPRSTARTA